MENKKRYEIAEVFELLGKDNLEKDYVKKQKRSIKVDGYDIYDRSLRYSTFYQKGVKCACCGKEGTHFELDADQEGESSNRRHFNLYADDGTLMTKDHIIPRSLGGADSVSNMQTLCEKCNKEKANSVAGKVLRVFAYPNNPDLDIKVFNSLNEAALYCCQRSNGNKQTKHTLGDTIKITIRFMQAVNTDIALCGYRWKTKLVELTRENN